VRIAFDEGLPCGPFTIRVEDGLVTDVARGVSEDARPATRLESEAFWRHFEGRGRFCYAFDFRRFTPFQADVMRALSSVRPGERVTYGELAILAGHPMAHRAVGSVMAGNPYSIFFGCHRVVPRSGGVGSYGPGGAGLKAALLEWEARRYGDI